ncbi:MAG: hypothetical protein HYR51_03040 [Candidatus Rokubacteria bacterium]|nr:hypothetical protein [Candidatus Rokubacteria bacterium]
MTRIVPLVVVLLMSLVAGAVHGAEWGAIVPGQTTQEAVRAQYGEPSKRATKKVDGYDTTEWLYEGTRAPGGVRRLAVDFGLLTPAGYRPEVVRVIRLDLAPGAFTRPLIERGWGIPNRVGKEGDTPLFFYDTGLIVLFDRDGWMVQTLVFTPPQPTAPR